MTIVLRGGRVIDPASETDQIADVVVDGTAIVDVGADAGARHPDAEVRDCSGLLVTPGLIDLHCHVFGGLGDFCLEPDPIGVHHGVPVLVDGGTSGIATFDISRRAWIDHPDVRTKVYAFLDANQLYLATKDFICHKLEIANDLRNLDVDSARESFERHADIGVGFKVRACYVGDDETRSPFLEAAQAVADTKPIMVHLGRFPFTPTISTPALLRVLRPGDIITHAFRGAGGMIGDDDKVIAEFRDAVDRGVRLDVGHSGTDFRFRDARRLMDQGYLPDTISTDLNIFNVEGPVFSLATTMSKIWHLGVDLPDVIAMASLNSARSIGRLDEVGSLAAGRTAHVSVLEILEEPTELSDGKVTEVAERVLRPVGCLAAGAWFDADAVVHPPAAAA
ncbi:MAG: amidohydrolase family protein [Actinomycetota bacterium]